jgi:hypothetical protein
MSSWGSTLPPEQVTLVAPSIFGAYTQGERLFVCYGGEIYQETQDPGDWAFVMSVRNDYRKPGLQ